MSPAQNHYFKLLDAAQSNWEGAFPSIKEAADASDIAIKLASPVIRRVLGQLKRGKMPTSESMDAIRQGVKSGQIDMASLPEVLQAQLKSQAAKSPTKAMLAAGGLGGLGGYFAGKRSGESSAGESAATGFGAGIATGLAAPSILNGLNQIVANQGLMPGSYAPSDAEYFMQI